jgi:glyceraldehyde 3-phosphate dehydrogenase
MSPVKVAINGFGRIGRHVVRVAANDPGVEIVAINDLYDSKTLSHLLKYDSTAGRAALSVEASEDKFVVNGHTIKLFAEKNPENLPWKELGIDVVLECTGFFADKDKASAHLKAGAKKVIISAPAKNVDATFVVGVNHETYNAAEHNVVSNASCTTNCLAPVAKVLHDYFKIEHGLMTTIHAYTNDQRILDLPHKDLRRARAAALSQIPTTTGAAKAVGLVLPDLAGKLDGMAIRIPTPNVSCVDLTVVCNKKTSAKEVNSALKKASENELKGILGYSDEPLVSIDYNGNPHSSIVDGLSTKVLGNMIKVLSWYDNETAFSVRMVDLSKYMGERL